MQLKHKMLLNSKLFVPTLISRGQNLLFSGHSIYGTLILPINWSTVSNCPFWKFLLAFPCMQKVKADVIYVGRKSY